MFTRHGLHTHGQLALLHHRPVPQNLGPLAINGVDLGVFVAPRTWHKLLNDTSLDEAILRTRMWEECSVALRNIYINNKGWIQDHTEGVVNAAIISDIDWRPHNTRHLVIMSVEVLYAHHEELDGRSTFTGQDAYTQVQVRDPKDLMGYDEPRVQDLIHRHIMPKAPRHFSSLNSPAYDFREWPCLRRFLHKRPHYSRVLRETEDLLFLTEISDIALRIYIDPDIHVSFPHRAFPDRVNSEEARAIFDSRCVSSIREIYNDRIDMEEIKSRNKSKDKPDAALVTVLEYHLLRNDGVHHTDIVMLWGHLIDEYFGSDCEMHIEARANEKGGVSPIPMTSSLRSQVARRAASVENLHVSRHEQFHRARATSR